MTTDQAPNEPTPLEKRAKQLLQAGAEQLDGQTRSRLTQGRHAALDALRPKRKSVSWWLPAGAAAAVMLAVIVSLNPRSGSIEQSGAQLAMAPVDELEIVTAEDSLEFYRDVEFYAWLDTVLDDESTESSGA